MAKKRPSHYKSKKERLPPLFSYYGSKWISIPRYPAPRHETIIEPFAGSATYALYYPQHKVKLYDAYEPIVIVWNYIINASEKEIRDIPIDYDIVGGNFPTDMPEEQRLLVGFWMSSAVARPRKQWTKVAKKKQLDNDWRIRVANSQKFLRHWTCELKSYDEIDNEYATWFIDPPYNNKAGQEYAMGSKKIDYEKLGKWCLSRRGNIIVCENVGADWLPFKFLYQGRSQRDIVQKKGEVIYTDISDRLFEYKPPKRSNNPRLFDTSSNFFNQLF